MYCRPYIFIAMCKGTGNHLPEIHFSVIPILTYLSH